MRRSKGDTFTLNFKERRLFVCICVDQLSILSHCVAMFDDEIVTYKQFQYVLFHLLLNLYQQLDQWKCF